MPYKEETSLPGAYLLGLLSSGARPFSYRSGVYQLLGAAPPAPHRMAFLPPMPPVGFHYAPHRGPDVMSEAPPALPLEASSARPPESASVDEAHRWREEAPASREHAPSGFSAPPRRPDAAAPSVARSAPLAPPRIEQRIEQRPELENEQRQSSEAVLSEAASSEAASLRALPKGVTPAASATPRTPAPGDPAPVKPALRSEAYPPEPSPEPLPDRPVGLAIPGLTRRRSSFAHLMAALQDETAPPVAPSASSHSASSHSAPLAGRKDEGEAPAQPGRSEAATPVKPLLRPDGAARASALRETASPSFQPGARRDAAVERIRHATAAPRPAPAPAQETPRSEPPRAPAHPASARPASAASVPQPVVVVRQAPRGGRRTPRAFWASSALRSTHLRMLR